MTVAAAAGGATETAETLSGRSAEQVIATRATILEEGRKIMGVTSSCQ